MLTLTQKANLIQRWPALTHAKWSFIAMAIGCFLTLLVLVFKSFGLVQWPYPSLPTNIMSLAVISSTALRFFLVRCGWSAVTVKELDNLSFHLQPNNLLGRESIDFETSRLNVLPLPDEIQGDLLRLAGEQGWVAWSQLRGALRINTGGPVRVEWLFIGKGDAPANAQEWKNRCTPRAQLDGGCEAVETTMSLRRL